MQGMTKTIPELFAMLKSAKVEIKKEHPVLMVNKTTSFNKKGKGKKGNFKKNGKQVVNLGKKPKAGPKPKTECFYCKGNGHWKWNLLGNAVISKNFLRTCKIMVMHRNERGECVHVPS